MSMDHLESTLIEVAVGLLVASHEDAVTRDCAIRLALDIYSQILDLQIKAVNAGVGEFVADQTEKRKGSN